jgi:hypothetical protein
MVSEASQKEARVSEDLFMMSTVEVRWFGSGAVPPGLEEWFQQGEIEPEEQPRRTDHYLRPVLGDSQGIKLREGRIEVKRRTRSYGMVPLHPKVAGLVECWRKWSFELAGTRDSLEDMLVPAYNWIAVRKERRMRLYSLAAGGRVAAVTTDEAPERGCGLELTGIAVAGEVWWSLGFETFGGSASLREGLFPVTEHLLSQGHAPTLDAQASYSYLMWLATLPG